MCKVSNISLNKFIKLLFIIKVGTNGASCSTLNPVVLCNSNLGLICLSGTCQCTVPLIWTGSNCACSAPYSLQNGICGMLNNFWRIKV